VAVALRRRRYDDALDARDLPGNDRHQHRRGQRRAAARDVRADRAERAREKGIVRQIVRMVVDRIGQLPRVKLRDALARQLQAGGDLLGDEAARILP
jgi:vacuolar-type H+-ATPase subunit E/Vma4